MCDVRAKRLLKRACDVRACGRLRVRLAIAIFARFKVKKAQFWTLFWQESAKNSAKFASKLPFCYKRACAIRILAKHGRATCLRPKIECANMRACDAKNRRNSEFG